MAFATLAGCATISDVPARGNGFAIQIWGSCHPEDCDWGTERIRLFTSSVDDSTEAATQAFLATYSNSFSENTVIGRPLASDRMQIQVLTRFTDGSARSNYSVVYELVR